MHRIIDIIALSADYLKEHGLAQPRRNAELLLSHVLEKSRIELYLEYDRPLAEAELNALRTLLKARAAHKPLQYVLGTTEFFSLPFLITEGIFIPRPETEILVQEAVDYMKGLPATDRIVVFDLGTGCGCIAVSVAHAVQNCTVYASDISSQAVALARRNAKRNNVEERITVLQGDMFQPFVEHRAPKANVIISNPPYVAEKDWERLPDEVSRFEPRQSLAGGEAGLDFLRRISDSAELFLKPGGRLFLEVGQGQSDAVVAFLEGRQKYIDIRSRQDYNGVERVISARFASEDVAP